jgi:hypothetical protein
MPQKTAIKLLGPSKIFLWKLNLTVSFMHDINANERHSCPCARYQGIGGGSSGTAPLILHLGTRW